MPPEHDAIPEHGRLEVGSRESFGRSRQVRSVGSARRLTGSEASPKSTRRRHPSGTGFVMEDVASDAGVTHSAGGTHTSVPHSAVSPVAASSRSAGAGSGAGSGAGASAAPTPRSSLSIRTSAGREASAEDEFKLSGSTGSMLSATSKGHSHTSSGEFHKAYAPGAGGQRWSGWTETWNPRACSCGDRDATHVHRHTHCLLRAALQVRVCDRG